MAPRRRPVLKRARIAETTAWPPVVPFQAASWTRHTLDVYSDSGLRQIIEGQGKPVMEFDQVWARITSNAGGVFRQKTGREFTYTVTGSAVIPSTTNRVLPRGDFAKAYDRAPLTGPGQLQDLQGPSYLWAIITDDRIAPHPRG